MGKLEEKQVPETSKTRKEGRDGSEKEMGRKKLLQRAKKEQEEENRKRSREADGRLAILVLAVLTGPAQRQRDTENQYRESREHI